MARFDHSGHDFPHTEVRVRRVAPSIRNNGSEKDGWNGAGERKEKTRSAIFLSLGFGF